MWLAWVPDGNTECLVAVAIDVLRFDVFQYQIRLAPGCDARIEELCDAWISESCQNAAFSLEPLFGILAKTANVKQLDGNPATESPVAALRQPDTAHASMSDLGEQRIHAHLLACQSPSQQERRPLFFEKPFVGQFPMFLKQPFQCAGQSNILCSQ